MSKKAQGISINTVIIAAIALAVLLVLFVIFTGRLGIFTKGVGEVASCENACKSLGKTKGEAVNKPQCDSESKTYIPGTYTDLTSKDYVCCCTG